MIRTVILAALALVALALPSEARPRARVVHAHPDCNVLWPCAGVAPSARGELVVKAMGGFGSARLVYTPQTAARRASAGAGRAEAPAATIVPHPAGCPPRAFCGCGAAVRVFGRPVRDLWPAAAWFKFPRAAPAAGMVAVRRHHVFVLEAPLGGDRWQVYDANSGRRATRIHARSIAGYAIVNPRG